MTLEDRASVRAVRTPQLTKSKGDRTRPAALLAIGALLILAATGCGSSAGHAAAVPAAHVSAPSHPPVVVISLDEFPTTSLVGADGKIDVVRYPNFAALARGSDWFPYATAPADETPRAMGALLTGSLPGNGRSPNFHQMPRNLFTLLGKRYRIDSSEEVTNLCPPKLCRGAHSKSGHDVLRELAQGRPQRFGAWVRSIHATRRPTLFFKHVLLPHGPWQYLPSGQRTVVGAEPVPGWQHAFGVPWVSTQKYQRHLLQLGYVDKLIGSAMRRLKAEGLYDRSMIVVTADNGESFGRVDNGHEISRRNFGDIALTPLFIKRPGQQRGSVPIQHVRTQDVVPTIAAITHTKIPYRIDGHSVYGRASRSIPSRTVVYQRSGHKYTLTGPGLRRWAKGAQKLKLRLFGSGNSGPGLYGVGPFRGLVGTDPARLHPSPAGTTRATLNDAAAYRAVRLSSAFLPSYVTGTLTGVGRTPPRAVAVAINGKVAATSPTFRTTRGGPLYYAAMVPPSALRNGANQVRLFAIAGTSSAPRLGAL